MYQKSLGGMLTVTKLHSQVSDNKVTSPGIGQSDILPLWGFCGRHKGRSIALSPSSACMFLGYTPPAHHKRTHTNTHTNTHTDTHTHTCTQTHRDIHTHTHRHRDTHTHTHRYTHACMHAHTHTYTQTQGQTETQ